MSDEFKILTVGSDLSELDIFLTVNDLPINASGVDFRIYDASNVLAASGTATNPSTGRYLASGTVPAGFNLGRWAINWLVTPVGGTLVTAVQHFDVQALTIAFGFAPATDRTTSIYDCVRLDIGDPDAVVFGDEFLQRILIKAIRRLNNKLGLTPHLRGPTGIEGQFGGRRIRVIQITVDLDTGIITPSGDEYEDILCLQMEYIIATAEVSALKRLNASASSGPYVISAVNTAVNDGIEVVNADGIRINIGGSRIQARVNLMKYHADTLKEELQMAVRAYMNRLSASFGKMVY